MMSDLQCPYCEHSEEASRDCSEPSTHYEQECSNCNKIFGFTFNKIFGFTLRYYTTSDEYILPCANGEKHDYKRIIGSPKEYFIGRYRCTYCGNEVTKNDELKLHAEEIRQFEEFLIRRTTNGK